MIAKTTSMLTARFGPSAASVLVHVVAVTAFAGHVATSPTPGDSVAPIEVSLVADEIPIAPDPTPVELAPAVAKTASAGAPHMHHHAYPVTPEHDARDHDPSLVHVPLGAAPPSPAPQASVVEPAPPPRFTMSFAGPSTAPHDHDQGHGHAHDHAAATPLPESSVSRPARLLASAALAYPAEARSAEVEADVPLELVVDAQGAVIDARVLVPAGLGLDAAALAAVRRYRFTPAERGGQPVPVRMRWSVEFRLR